MEEDHKKAYLYAIRLLAKRDYSEYKLRMKLRDKGLDKESIDYAIEEVLRLNYLREDNYIEARIKGFMHKNCSISYIINKLNEEYLTVDHSTIQEIFDEYRITEEEQLSYLVEKKFPKDFTPSDLSYEDKRKLKLKIMRFVATKGHSPSKASDLVEKKIRNVSN